MQDARQRAQQPYSALHRIRYQGFRDPELVWAEANAWFPSWEAHSDIEVAALRGHIM